MDEPSIIPVIASCEESGLKILAVENDGKPGCSEATAAVTLDSYSSKSEEVREFQSDDDFSADTANRKVNEGSLQELHPLHNPVILTHLFDLCRTDHLCKFRLVSKVWHDLCLGAWRSSFPLTIRYQNEEKIFLVNCFDLEQQNYDNLSTKLPFHDFIKYVEDTRNHCDKKPFSQLHLQGWTLPSKGTQPFHGSFFNFLGHGVTTLKLTTCVFRNFEQFREEICGSFPNLRSLAMDDCLFPPGGITVKESMAPPKQRVKVKLKSLDVGVVIRNETGLPWLEFLSEFLSSLTSLTLVIPANEVDLILEAMKMITLGDKFRLVLRHFYLYPILELSRDVATHERLALCGKLRLPLQNIRIRMCPNLGENVVVKDIIQFHGATLRELEIFEDVPCSSHWKFPFQVELDNLHKLKISEGLLESLEVLKYTPNLGRLDILDAEHDIFKPIITTETKIVSNTLKKLVDVDDNAMAELKLMKLKELSIYFVVSDDDNDLRSLLGWMPNVTDLAMVLNDKQFAIVCEGWRQLTRLEVLSDELTDGGVIGMEMGGDLPNISLLNDLEIFECWTPKLTEASVFNGFMKLPKLKRLEFYSQCSNPEKMELGEGAKDALRKEGISLKIICFCDVCGL